MNNEKEKDQTEEEIIVANMNEDDWHFLLQEMEHH